ncbi:MAG: U32 family peptidase [Phycisphaerae bacterium]
MPDNKKIELLAPAGKKESLIAAIEAGADAVYLGLKTLNARRGADNFEYTELADVVSLAHEKGVKVHLALNTIIAARETGQAVRALEVASQAKVDAVIVTDPMFFSFIALYPDMEFHFSTQAAIENTLGMSFAKRIGVKRVVLAREMTFEEVKAASAQAGVETEIFVQGAMCFGVSGKCLMSSWGGGRSGNRGTCTSPCRVLWTTGEGEGEAYMSMHDLSLIEYMDKIREAHVSCLKIEGRLKNASWVSRAVGEYRKALDGVAFDEQIISSLSDVTGREQSAAYFSGHTEGLCGRAGRAASAAEFVSDLPQNKPDGSRPKRGWNVAVSTSQGAFTVNVSMEGEDFNEEFSLPLTVLKREKKGVTVASLAGRITCETRPALTLLSFTSDEPHKLLARKTVNGFDEQIASIYYRWQKKQADDTIRIDLPENVASAAVQGRRSEQNTLSLRKDSKVKCIRLDYRNAKKITGTLSGIEQIVLENVPADKERTLQKGWIVSLPAVFYESQIDELRALVSACAASGRLVEANSFAGIELAKEAGAKFCTGPEIWILNHLAARALKKLGAQSGYVSIEADKRQVTELCMRSELPLNMLLYGYPTLCITRAEMSEDLQDGAIIEDARGIKMTVSRGDITVLRSAEPFSLLGASNPAVRVQTFVADLCAITDETRLIETVKMLKSGKYPTNVPAKRFNYNRTLK